jgi:hypothetical protein
MNHAMPLISHHCVIALSLFRLGDFTLLQYSTAHHTAQLLHKVAMESQN